MLHRVHEGPDQYLSINTSVFESMIEYLNASGFHTITLKQLRDWNNGLISLPPNPVVLTFDDGYMDALTNASVILDKYGYVGVAAIFTRVIDTAGL